MKVSEIICLVLVCVSAVYGAVSIGDAPVTDEKLIKQGYSCQSAEYGLMKNGEINDNPSKDRCLRIICGGGQLEYQSCGIATGPCIGPGDNSKPYPDCCFSKIC